MSVFLSSHGANDNHVVLLCQGLQDNSLPSMSAAICTASDIYWMCQVQDSLRVGELEQRLIHNEKYPSILQRQLNLRLLY
jgi:hypothetical protein